MYGHHNQGIQLFANYIDGSLKSDKLKLIKTFSLTDHHVATPSTLESSDITNNQ